MGKGCLFLDKKVWKIIALVSAAVLLVIAVIVAVMVFQTVQQPGYAVIGGADQPTAVYIIGRLLSGSPFLIAGILSFLLLMISGVVLLYQKVHK